MEAAAEADRENGCPPDSPIENGKTFIDQLLGEMKNQFNKTDMRGVPQEGACDESASPSQKNSALKEALCKTTSFKPNLAVNNGEVDKTEELSQAEPETAVTAAVTTAATLAEEEPDTASSTAKGETTPEDDSSSVEEKPRIVMTFRKPATNDLLKPKSKQTTNRRALRAKLRAAAAEDVVVKRSSRRRSRDCNESVLQSAIARKEKSYNESSRPQRLTRQLKPTPKILENLAANAAALRGRRGTFTKQSQHLTSQQHHDSDGGISDEGSESDVPVKAVKRKAKTRNAKLTKRSRVFVNNGSSKDSDSDDSEMKKKPPILSEPEKPCRRSHRLSSRAKSGEEIAAELTESKLKPESEVEESNHRFTEVRISNQVEFSQTCLCTKRTNMFATSAKSNEPVFCTAVDSIRNLTVGCNNITNHKEYYLVRPSIRVPYLTLCKQHFNRLIRHNCCPKCGVFCTEGQFMQCTNGHLYHKTCQPTNGNVKCCPHCKDSSNISSVYIEMQTLKPPVFMPQQKQHSPIAAKMTFNSKSFEILDGNGVKSLFSAANLKDLVEDLPEKLDTKITIETLLQLIQNDDLKRLVLVLNCDKSLLVTVLSNFNNGTILHYAAQRAASAMVLHLLVSIGAEVDALDKNQNTPLTCAILEHKNEFVEYFLSAGADTMLKSTDGMTPLHLAAKVNNIQACEMLLKSSEDAVTYVNTMDDGGWTPLVWACEQAHFDIVKLLLKKGSDSLLRDVEQNIALHWAVFSGDVEIVRLLLTHRSDINAINVHGDSPLHIAARQDKHECVLLLLLRNADVNVINKAGELPLDCCKPLSDCHTAISLNLCLQSVATAKQKFPSRVLICNDITRGREKNPIQCINEVDETPLPDNFVYLSTNCITCNEVQIDRKITMMHSCDCEHHCYAPSCVCCEHSMRCWYGEKGKLVENYNYQDPPMIFECNQLCSCNVILCNNRVVQHGISQRFEVFKTRSKGWGLRTLRSIPKGTFVCEYIGEVITETEAERRDDDSFMFDMDNGETQNSFCIDAKYYGNLARFINHSCDPNLVPIRLFVEHHDLRFPRICFFAKRDIEEKEEIGFDYGIKFWIVKYKIFTCDCDSKECKYSVDAIEETIENYQRKLELVSGES